MTEPVHRRLVACLSVTQAVTSPNGPPPGSVGPARTAIRASLPRLVPSERRVAEHVLASAEDIVHCSVTEVAIEVGVSPSTVVRACQHLGYKGFQDLKLHLVRDTVPALRSMQGDVTPEDSPAEILAKVLGSGEDALRSALHTIDSTVYAQAVKWLADSRTILFAAVGTSAPLAQDAAYRFLTVGARSEAPADVHVQHVRAALLEPGDSCVAISHTGATNETIATVTAARDAGAHTIVVTSFVRSPLTSVAEAVLVASSPEVAYRVEAMASRIAHLCVLDALVVGVALEQEARAADTQSVVADVLSEHRF